MACEREDVKKANRVLAWDSISLVVDVLQVEQALVINQFSTSATLITTLISSPVTGQG